MSTSNIAADDVSGDCPTDGRNVEKWENGTKKRSKRDYGWNDQVVRDAKTGQVVGFSGLNARQRLFVESYVANGGNGYRAAEFCGYSSPSNAASQLLATPRIQDALRDARSKALDSLSCRAIGVLREVMDDQHAPASAKVQAARLSLALAGHVEPSPQTASAQNGTGVPLESMSVDALESFVAGGLDALRRLRPVIDAQAVVMPGDSGPS